MRKKKLHRLGATATLAAALALMVAGTAKAQFTGGPTPYPPPNPLVTGNAYPYNTFTFTTAGAQTFIGGTYTYDSYSISTPNFRQDYTTNAGVGTGVAYNSTVDHTGNGGGSIQMNEVVQTAGTPTNAAVVMDVAPDANGGTGLSATGYSFWLQILPGSAVSGANGASFGAGASGYFSTYYKTQPNYNGVYGGYNVYLNGVNEGAGGWQFGDPNYTGNSDAGTWDYVYVQFTDGSGNPTVVPNFAAIGFQNYLDNSASSRNFLAGAKVSWVIDDLTVYVPEPASMAMLGLAAPALLMRRRAAAAGR
jgi:hypothetical protein